QLDFALHVPRAAGGPVGAFEPFPSLQRPPSRCLASSFPLPRQPVPPLAQTLERYLRSLEVLVTPEELEETRQLVQEFGAPGGEGERLQAQLERRAARMENWVDRLPLTVHSSPAVVLPKQDYSDWRGQLRWVLGGLWVGSEGHQQSWGGRAGLAGAAGPE
uniref:Choline/carnitine acyltransferase domain-containing protein n=1 Tax=Gopherus agassizii TaxID=38772 RepID=A0A452GP33_9SAUR